MWHRAKCEELRPHGHLHCVITADSCRDNRYIQPSSYTQVCRHAHINKDLCAHLVVRSFLTRGWRGSNSLYSLSFSQNCCLLAWTHPHLGAKKREGITLSVSFLSKKTASSCIWSAGRTVCVCRHHRRSQTGLIFMWVEGKSWEY